MDGRNSFLLSRQNESVWLELSELVDILYVKASDAEYSVPPSINNNRNGYIKGKLSDSFTNYNYVGNTKVSVSIKKT